MLLLITGCADLSGPDAAGYGGPAYYQGYPSGAYYPPPAYYPSAPFYGGYGYGGGGGWRDHDREHGDRRREDSGLPRAAPAAQPAPAPVRPLPPPAPPRPVAPPPPARPPPRPPGV